MSQPWDKEFRSDPGPRKKRDTAKKTINKIEGILYAAAMVSIVYVAIVMHTVKSAKKQYNTKTSCFDE